MTDEEYRKQAWLKMDSANRLSKLYHSINKIIAEYEATINLFSNIEHKTRADIIALYDAYHTLAIFYFNLATPNYKMAAECYLNGINSLLFFELGDSDYRTLTLRYIDLADACYESHNLVAGDAAILNAITAFRAIREKKPQELSIGDPIINFLVFHEHYEEQSSRLGYLASNKYKNHQSLFCQRLVTSKEEDELLELLGAISIGQAQNISNNIDAMLSDLSQLSMQNHSLFKPVPINQLPGDVGYRTMAMQLLKLAQESVEAGQIKSTIASYRQAVSILKQINAPAKNDLNIIEYLEREIEMSQQLRTQAPQFGSSMAIALGNQGLFAHNTAAASAGTMNTSEDEEASAMQY